MAQNSDRRSDLEARIAAARARIQRIEERARTNRADVNDEVLLETNRRLLAAAQRQLEAL